MHGKSLHVIAAVIAMTVLLAACNVAPSAPAAAATEAPVAAVMPTTAAPAAEAPAAEAPAAEAPAAEAGATTFTIDAAQSTVRFILDEELGGQPKTVVGETSTVVGSVNVNLDDYSATTISPIQVDARTFVTDSNMRNGAIRRFILQSDQDSYQYIVFTPTAIDGLPAETTVGAPFDLQVTGDLQIRDVTQPVTFDVTVAPVSATELQISGKTLVQRADFDLQIPNVPNVANVEEAVELELDLVAVAQ